MNMIENIALYIHIFLGLIAIVAGSIALYAKKGQITHIKFGQIFSLTMVVSSSIGAVIGLLNYSDLFITFLAGVLSVTLVISGIQTFKSNRQHSLIYERGVAILNVLNYLVILCLALWATRTPNKVLYGFHAEDYFYLSVISLLVLIGDVRYFLFGGVTRPYIVCRHIWRMCIGFFIAVGSAFTGPGMKVFPDYIQKSGVLSVPEIAILIIMFIWLFRVKLLKKIPSIKRTFIQS